MTDGRTVYIVDDDPGVRDSLALLLSLRGLRIAQFACAEDFLRAHDPAWSGCVLADLRLPGLDGLALMRELAGRGAALPVIVMTAHGDVGAARAAFKAHAVDFLEKPFDDTDLFAAVEAAFGRERSREASAGEARRRAAAQEALTGRERDVALLLAQGLHNRDVAARLGISPRTVEVHKARVMAKLGTRNLAELIRVVG